MLDCLAAASSALSDGLSGPRTLSTTPTRARTPGYRNGYEQGYPSEIRTAEGEISVQVPQVRDAPETYRSELMAFLYGNSDVLEQLTVETPVACARFVDPRH